MDLPARVSAVPPNDTITLREPHTIEFGTRTRSIAPPINQSGSRCGRHGLGRATATSLHGEAHQLAFKLDLLRRTRLLRADTTPVRAVAVRPRPNFRIDAIRVRTARTAYSPLCTFPGHAAVVRSTEPRRAYVASWANCAMRRGRRKAVPRPRWQVHRLRVRVYTIRIFSCLSRARRVRQPSTLR